MSTNKPKILFYDIETRPSLGYVWGKYDQNILSFKEEWSLLSFAYKFQGDKTVKCETRKGQKDDRKLVEKLHSLFNEADITVAHNGNSFDHKKTRARMVYYNLTPPKIASTIDTKLVAKANFNFTSNSLNDLGVYLGLGEKVKHQGFDLWLGCMKDKPDAWHTMIEYNKQDVILLEKVYERFLPWIQNHPNVARILNPLDPQLACRNCGSKKIQKRGMRVTKVNVQQQYQCQDCGSWFVGKMENKKNK